jgi:hypothetical protein
MSLYSLGIQSGAEPQALIEWKTSKSKRRKLNTDSRWLNSEEGLVQCEREVAEAEAEAACKQVRVDEKQAEKEEQEQRDLNKLFVGSLNGTTSNSYLIELLLSILYYPS